MPEDKNLMTQIETALHTTEQVMASSWTPHLQGLVLLVRYIKIYHVLHSFPF